MAKFLQAIGANEKCHLNLVRVKVILNLVLPLVQFCFRIRVYDFRVWFILILLDTESSSA
jgi:hypothetical protein